MGEVWVITATAFQTCDSFRSRELTLTPPDLRATIGTARRSFASRYSLHVWTEGL